MTPVDLLLSKLSGAKKSGDGWSAQCPAHEDQHASLSVSAGDEGTVLVKRHAGCDTSAIVAARPQVCRNNGCTLAKLKPAPVVRIIELPGLAEHGDIVDWIVEHPKLVDTALTAWHCVSFAQLP